MSAFGVAVAVLGVSLASAVCVWRAARRAERRYR